jgi:SAM-dependent methyltransferase
MRFTSSIECDLCGREFVDKSDIVVPLIFSDCRSFGDKKFTLLFCKCGHYMKKYDSFTAQEIKEFYKKYEIYSQANGNEQKIQFKGTSSSEFMKRSEYIIDILKLFPGMNYDEKILDFGCGNGELLKSFYKESKELILYGADIDIRSAFPFGENFSNIGYFQTNQIPKNLKFNVITFVHVLEHVEKIGSILEILDNHLESQGHFVVQLPDIENNEFDFIVADHIHHFTRRSLINFFTKWGYSLIHENDKSNKECTLIFKKEGNYHQESLNVINKIEKKVNEIKNERYMQKFYIFGTSILGSWIHSLLMQSESLENLQGFIDEDVNRIGNSYKNKLIFDPSEVENESMIIAAVPQEIFLEIKHRYSDKNFSWINFYFE